jgi:Protein of unknown function (DUF4057)
MARRHAVPCAHLQGNDIFAENVEDGSAARSLAFSEAKLHELGGSNIFGEGQQVLRHKSQYETKKALTFDCGRRHTRTPIAAADLYCTTAKHFTLVEPSADFVVQQVLSDDTVALALGLNV